MWLDGEREYATTRRALRFGPSIFLLHDHHRCCRCRRRRCCCGRRFDVFFFFFLFSSYSFLDNKTHTRRLVSSTFSTRCVCCVCVTVCYILALGISENLRDILASMESFFPVVIVVEISSSLAFSSAFRHIASVCVLSFYHISF